MPNYPETFDHMLASWNELDSDKVRGHLEKALSPDIRFVDPSIDLSGIDAFEENVHEVQTRLPNAKYSRTSSVDSQHGFFRYHWAIHQDGELVMPGFDVVETQADGRIKLVIGFFGELQQTP